MARDPREGQDSRRPLGLSRQPGERWGQFAERVANAFGLVLLLVLATYALGSLTAFHGWTAVLTTLVAALAGVGPAPPPQPRGFFGFEMDEKNKIVLVSRVLKDSPAAKAGLKKGDRIVSAQGTEVSTIQAVLDKASKLTAGKTLTLTIERDDAKQDLKITAGDGL